MTPARVALIIQLSLGGICQYTHALGNALADLGCEVSLISSPGRYELERFERRYRLVPCWFYGYSGRGRVLRQKLQERLASTYWQTRLGRQIGALVKQARAEVAHQQWPINPPLEPIIWRALRDAIKRPLPLVYTAHEVFPHERGDQAPDLELPFRDLYREPDRIIVHGGTLRRQAIEQAAVPPERIRVVPHGNAHFLADQVGAPPAAEARRSFGLEPRDRVVLFFGYVRHYKGLDVLLLALERLRRRPGLSRVVLLVGGFLPGTDWWGGHNWDDSFYGGLARSLKLEAALRISPDYLPIEDLGRFFAAADVVCLPYRVGSQSGVIQLAYAYSKPVVATRVGSLPDAVDHGRSGLLVPLEDPDRLAEALEQLLAEPSAAERMGRYAREWSGEAFAWRPIAEQTLRIYAEASS